MSKILLRSVPFRQRLKKCPIDPQILQRIRQLKIGSTKERKFKGDRRQDIKARRDQLNSVKFKVTLKLSAQDVSQLRGTNKDEIAFAGRSNVGKSSLLNALLNRPHGLAPVSRKPGETRALNFYEIYSPTLKTPQPVLIDMPGYGFSYISEDQPPPEWPQLSREYVCERPSLKTLWLLIDSRHGIKKSDEEFLQLLSSQSVPCSVVLTKADLVPQSHLAKMVWLVQQEVQGLVGAGAVECVSAKTLAGVHELRQNIFTGA